MPKRKSDYAAIQAEQRRQREMLLEIKKAQADLDNRPAPEPRPEPSRAEKIKNFWHYRRFQIFGALVALVLIVLMVFQILNRTRPDCVVVMRITEYIDDSVLGEIETELSSICPDINGDGKTVVSIVDCSTVVGNDNYEYEQGQLVKLQSQFSLAESQVFLVDYDTYMALYESMEGKIWDNSLALPDMGGAAISVKNTPLTRAFCESKNLSPDAANWYLARRSIADTYLAEDSKAEQYNAAAEALMAAAAEKYSK